MRRRDAAPPAVKHSAETEAVLVALSPGQSLPVDLVAALAASGAGRSVYLVAGPSPAPTVPQWPGVTVLPAAQGLARAIHHVVQHANATRLAVIDGRAFDHLGQGAARHLDVVDALFESLRSGREIAVASCSPPLTQPWYGGAVWWLARWLVRRSGVAQPLAACFALRRSAWQAAAPQLDAGDRTFLLDLLAASPDSCVAEVAPGPCAGCAPTLAVGWEVLVSALRVALLLRVPRRWLSFAGVGALGTVTDALCTGFGLGLGLPFGVARSVGVAIGMVQNYLLNNGLTFAAQGQPATLRGLIVFGACQALGAGANWGLSMASFLGGAPWLVALLIGVAAGNILNFLTASRFVWSDDAPSADTARRG